MTRSFRHMCNGFTLIELLVVITVLGILVSLLLPAIQAVRESGRKTTCSNHIKQLTFAVTNFESSYAHLPSGGWGKKWAGISGLGTGPDQPGGWIYQTLPFLEQEILFSLGNAQLAADNTKRLQTPLPFLHCPSRRTAKLYSSGYQWEPYLHLPTREMARNDYAINGGSVFIEYGEGPNSIASASSHRWPKMDAMTGMCHQRSRVRFSEVVDGLSQTYMVGEKHLPRARYTDGRDWGDNESVYSGDDRDIVRYTALSNRFPLKPMSDEQTHELTFGHRGTRFGSAHGDGFQISFADGSVHQISYSIDTKIHVFLGNRKDNQSVNVDSF